MNQAKYIGMDVHQATISVAVIDSVGKLILESILETKDSTYLKVGHCAPTKTIPPRRGGAI